MMNAKTGWRWFEIRGGSAGLGRQEFILSRLPRWIDPVVLAVLWISLSTIVDPIGDFPLNDDFLFAMSARSVLEDFHFLVPSGSVPNVGPQAYWGALFCLLSGGFSFTALRISTLVLGLIGAIAMQQLFLQVWKSRSLAFIAALLLMVNPIYFGVAHSYMTDVPFLALVILSMVLLLKGWESDRGSLIQAGLVVALLAVLIRQLALVVFVGFACAQLAAGGVGHRNLRRAVLPLLIGLIVHFAFSRWLQDTGRKPYPSPMSDLNLGSILGSLRQLIFPVVSALQYLGLFLLPLSTVCLVGHGRRNFRPMDAGRLRSIVGFMALGGLLSGYVVKNAETMPSGSNILTYFGLGPLTLRDTYILKTNLPPFNEMVQVFWYGVTVLATLGGAVLAYSLCVIAMRFAVGAFKRLRVASCTDIPSIVPFVFCATTATSYFAIVLVIATKYPLFDRYLLLLLVLGSLAIPALKGDTTKRAHDIWVAHGIAALVLGGISIFSVLATHDYLQWNRLRWSASNTLAAKGIGADRVDGGYEFNGWLQYDPLYAQQPSKSWWWVKGDDFVIASGPVAGYKIEKTLTFKRWLTGRQATVVTLSRNSPAGLRE